MIIQSQFKPLRGFSNPHLQTLLPTLLKHNWNKQYPQQEFELPDGDFVDLAWSSPLAEIGDRPIVVIFHGLEGSINSPYAQHMMQAIEQNQWHAVLMHFRGCSGRPNNKARSYHSGETSDAKALIAYLQQQYPNQPIAAIGYSLGGNMLLKLQAEWGDASPLAAAVSICAPIQLATCADRIDQGFSRIYQNHLMKRLIKNVLRKYDQHDYAQQHGLSKDKLTSLKTFWQFDNAFTAPVHGFGTAQNYYQINSARGYLSQITQPTLAIQAVDDPFMTAAVIPTEDELGKGLQLEVSRYGGHVGFVSGNLLKPRYWLTERVPAYLSSYLAVTK